MQKRTPTADKEMPAEVLQAQPVPAGSLETPETPETQPVSGQAPKQSDINKTVPEAPAEKKGLPNLSGFVQVMPEASDSVETIPEISAPVETVPEQTPEKKEMPTNYNEENTVVIDGCKIEIKPTKLKYFRNKATSGYGIIKAVPLHELLTYGKGVVDADRDADQLLYDFLVGVFDGPEFVEKHYNEFDAENIDRICKIFGRLNHIDEKEEAARKNREAQAQQKR